MTESSKSKAADIRLMSHKSLSFPALDSMGQISPIKLLSRPDSERVDSLNQEGKGQR